VDRSPLADKAGAISRKVVRNSDVDMLLVREADFSGRIRPGCSPGNQIGKRGAKQLGERQTSATFVRSSRVSGKKRAHPQAPSAALRHTIPIRLHRSFVVTSRLNGASIPPVGQAQKKDQEEHVMRFGVFSRLALDTIPKPREWVVHGVIVRRLLRNSGRPTPSPRTNLQSARFAIS
jgi:hypothetical protein